MQRFGLTIEAKEISCLVNEVEVRPYGFNEAFFIRKLWQKIKNHLFYTLI